MNNGLRQERSGAILGIAVAVCTYFISQPNVAFAQEPDLHWVKLDTMSADQIEKAPEFVQHALGGTISAYREQWKNAKPLLDRNGKPFPGKHRYIAPTIAWAQMRPDKRVIGLSLSDSKCDGPNSATAADLFVCEAVISIQTGDNITDKTVSLCYAGPGKDSVNEVAYSQESKQLRYRVIIPDENTDYCSKNIEVE